jgi:hypothetical protein
LRIERSEILQDSGFFMVLAALIVFCHLLNSGVHDDGEDDERQRPSGGHQHEEVRNDPAWTAQEGDDMVAWHLYRMVVCSVHGLARSLSGKRIAAVAVWLVALAVFHERWQSI